MVVDTSALIAIMEDEPERRLFDQMIAAAPALNFGDCFAYALAKHLAAPLLFKGDDFSRTDIRSATVERAARLDE